MKQAVIKLAAKAEDLLGHLSNEPKVSGARLMVMESMLILHDEGIINNVQLQEAMSEIDLIYPVK